MTLCSDGPMHCFFQWLGFWIALHFTIPYIAYAVCWLFARRWANEMLRVYYDLPFSKKCYWRRVVRGQVCISLVPQNRTKVSRLSCGAGDRQENWGITFVSYSCILFCVGPSQD